MPEFTVCERGSPVTSAAPARAMLRGCRAEEDGERESHAGASLSVGPVSCDAIPELVARLFREDPALVDVIVQHFVDGPSGVVLSLREDLALVEYSRLREGVTAGRVAPFVAVLPTPIARYAELQRAVQRVHAVHGPCDLEFVGVERPRFVQLRPLTAPVELDAELSSTRMQLQELDVSRWGQVGYCVDLMEQPARDDALAALWAELLPLEVAPFAGRGADSAPLSMLKLGTQFYVDLDALKACSPTHLGAFRIGLRARRFLREAERALAARDALDPRAWMRHSIRLNLVWDLFAPHVPRWCRGLFKLRESVRARLFEAVPLGTRSPDIASCRRLTDTLERHDPSLTWIRCGPADSTGQLVVFGDFEAGPRFVFAGNVDAIPDGAVLVTRELYPELAPALSRVSAVLCEGGAIGSHLAILAREQRVPMKIQVSGLLGEATR